jgi:carboxypeptidase Q
VPFHDLGAKTVTLKNTGSTDHLSFDWAGIPGFQFIQDPIDYETRTHHSNMDSYDHLQIEDLKQAAIIVASFVYQTSIQKDMLPRKAPVKETFVFDGF